MKIKVTVNVYENKKTKGFASLELDEKIVIKNLRIVDGDKGLFVAYPSHYSEKDNKYYEDVYPLNAETRETIQNKVLEEYEKASKKSSKDEI